MDEKPDTRSCILETALQLFSLQGYDATGTQQIVDTSGVSKPTLYHYFGHKRGLLDVIVEKYGSILFNVVEQPSVYNHDLGINLNILTREMMSYALAHQNFFRFYSSLLASAPENETYRACTSLKEGINRRVDKRHTAKAFKG